MKTLHLLAMSAAMAALLIFAAAKVDAQQRAVGGGARINPSSHGGGMHGGGKHGGGKHGFHGGFGGVWIVQQEVPVIVEREVVREVPAAPVAVAAPAAPRKPYVIGSTYASLPPQGCMKLIEEGVSYYYCGGEWYRQLGGGRDAQYRAVARP